MLNARKGSHVSCSPKSSSHHRFAEAEIQTWAIFRINSLIDSKGLHTSLGLVTRLPPLPTMTDGVAAAAAATVAADAATGVFGTFAAAAASIVDTASNRAFDTFDISSSYNTIGWSL